MPVCVGIVPVYPFTLIVAVEDKLQKGNITPPTVVLTPPKSTIRLALAVFVVPVVLERQTNDLVSVIKLAAVVEAEEVLDGVIVVVDRSDEF